MKEIQFDIHFPILKLLNLDNAIQQLIQASKDACKLSYAPYSNFQVGCSILLENKEIIVGANIENAAYSTCICAERNALSTALTQYPDSKIISLAISHLNQNKNVDNWVAPCGECRQMMVEVAVKQQVDFPVYLYGNDENILMIKNVRDLLPLSFLAKDLHN